MSGLRERETRLRELLAAGARGTVCAMAFGPGHTLEAARMRVEAE